MRWVVQNNIATSSLPKSGHTSIEDCLRDGCLMDNERVKAVPTRIAWIRHPIERLVSAFSFFKSMVDRGVGVDGIIDNHASCYEDFIDYIFEEDNPHWRLQTEMLTEDGKWIPTITHKFEGINKLWNNYFPAELPRLNDCIHKPTTDYRQGEIANKYKEDLSLWHGL